MNFRENKNMKNLNNKKWKANGQKYLKELQAFLDKAESIENEEIRKEIIFQMLKCDNELTILAEDMFKKYEDYKTSKMKDYEDD